MCYKNGKFLCNFSGSVCRVLSFKALGAAAMMAIRVLLDHDVLEENIFLLSFLMAEPGVHSLGYAFPKVCFTLRRLTDRLSS